MTLLSTALSKEKAWDIIFGLGVAFLVLGAIVSLLLIVGLVRVALLGWKQLRSSDQQQRYIGLALLLGVACVPLYLGGNFMRIRWEQERAAAEHQAAEQRAAHEADSHWIKRVKEAERHDSIYFREMEAGKVDSSLFILDPHAEARWQQTMAARDSATQARKRQYLRTHQLSD